METTARTFSAARLYVFAALVVSLGVFLFRLQAFGDIEPRSDQAFFGWWAMGVEAANHVLPSVDPGESLMDAMARDETGLLTQVLRPVYNSPTEALFLLSLFLTAGAAKLFGGGFATLVAAGIFASAATVFVLALFPWGSRASVGPEPAGNRIVAGGAALLLGATALYPHLFSALGPHNIGIFFLVTGAVFTERAVGELLRVRHKGRWRAYLALFLAQGMALYAYKTNVFLLPPATGLFILTVAGPPLRRRIGVLLAYGAMVALLMVPVVAAMSVDAAKAPWARDAFSLATMMAQASAGGPWGLVSRTGLRAAGWFTAGAHLFSWPGLVGGLLGLAVLYRRRTAFPACLVAAHFLSWCVVPLFAGSELRTFPYVIPFLIVGFAYLLAWSVGRQRAGGGRLAKALPLVAVLVLAIAHLETQIPGLFSRERMAEAYPAAWQQYYAGQGELRPMVAEIERALPPDAVLMTWGYGLQYLWRVFKNPADDTLVPPAVNAMVMRQRGGDLPGYLARRRLHLPADAPLFLLLDPKVDYVDFAGLRDQMSALLGPGGFGIAADVHLVEKGHWNLQTWWPKEVMLYSVRPN